MADLTNINVGVLGHVDSGKTALCKALSNTASTAAFDKHPQSQERGITLDLGFSALQLADERVQFTFVDCPGHASLIRTIIGGAQIIDIVLLVVDVTKGIQTQTAECLVIAEITCPKMIIVLNKIDLIPEEKREATINKMKKGLSGALSKTKFKDAQIIEIAAKNGEQGQPIGVDKLLSRLKVATETPTRNEDGKFLFSVDHCFSIRGQGTVMTGTVIQGKVAINDSVEIVAIKDTRKVKGIQRFKQPLNSAAQGDRIGICVTQFDAKLIERGIVCSPGAVKLLCAAVIPFTKVPYFKGNISSGSKFHISLGHETVLGKITLFQSLDESCDFSEDKEYRYLDSLEQTDEEGGPKGQVFALIEMDGKGVHVIPDCKVLGSKLDTDIHTSSCRLAFHGRVSFAYHDKNYASNQLPKLRIFKPKIKQGFAERANNSHEVICKSMFKKETNIAIFTGLKAHFSSGEEGIIESAFGQSGKFKVRIPEGLKESTFAALKSGKKGKDQKPSEGTQIGITLSFKRYIFSKEMSQ